MTLSPPAPLIHSFYAHYLIEHVRRQGGDAEALRRRFSLPERGEATPTLALPARVLPELSHAAEVMLGDPFVGVHVACSSGPRSYGLLELAVRSAPTVSCRPTEVDMSWDGWREIETRGVLVAGRNYDADMTRGQVVALAAAVDAIAQRTGANITVVPADMDLTDECGPQDDEQAWCALFIGELVTQGGTRAPLAVPLDDMRRALERARAISPGVWAEVDAAFQAHGGKNRREDIEVRLGCTGGLPMAKLAFGVLGREDEGKGGTFVQGQDTDQRPHEIGVHGIQIDGCSFDGSSADPIDVGEAAHADRVRQFPGGAYYLIARYD